MNEIRCAIELRDAADSPGRIVGVILETGRVAVRSRARCSHRGSVTLAIGNGIRLLAEHRGRQVMRVHPDDRGFSEIRINEPLPDTAHRQGNGSGDPERAASAVMSVEFHSPRTRRRVSGVREVRSALVDAAAARSRKARTRQGRAEVRQQRLRLWL